MTLNPRLARFLDNCHIHHESVRARLGTMPLLATTLLHDLEVAHRTLVGAVSAGDAITAADAAFRYASLVGRIDQVVLRRRPPNKKQQRAAAVKAYVHGRSAAGDTVEKIIAAGLVPKSTVYRILKSKREVRKVRG